ncbi:MAG: acyl carrier protein [Prolixibacteraceae bacterium]|nr:acyl carrier protein [Prolixibacteraceae bacterium]
MDTEIFEKIKEIVRAIVNQPGADIQLGTTSDDVEGWDSLHHMMIITEIEKAFGVKFDFMEILDLKTVGDICDLVKQRKK